MGFSALDVLAALDAGAEQELEWSDGSATQLELELMKLPSHICQASEDTLEFEAEVVARTRDGRIDTRLSVLISAAPERGSIGEIWVRQNGTGQYSSVLVDIEAVYHGARRSGSISLSGVDPQARSAPGSQTSAVIATGRWAQ